MEKNQYFIFLICTSAVKKDAAALGATITSTVGIVRGVTEWMFQNLSVSHSLLHLLASLIQGKRDWT